MQGPDGKWNTWTGDKMAWDASAVCSNNPAYGGRGNPKQGDEFEAAPNIDHTQVSLLIESEMLQAWLMLDHILLLVVVVSLD